MQRPVVSRHDPVHDPAPPSLDDAKGRSEGVQLRDGGANAAGRQMAAGLTNELRRLMDLVHSYQGPRLHIAARSATEVVDALEEQGLVERRPDPDDRRATLVSPTRAAKTELAQVDRRRRAQTERFLAVLSDADRAELDRILRILVDQ